MKLYSALYGSFYPFDKMGLFSEHITAKVPDDLEAGGCLVVWGGGDISPSLYGREVGRDTNASATLSHRDHAEWELMKRAKELEMPIIGICRGAQMLCALAGGFLIQDVTNHTSGHKVKTKEGEEFHVSSLHHQMLYPFEVDHEMVAWSDSLSRHYKDVNEDITVPLEPEFVYFPKEKGIAIQWHPEFMRVNEIANLYVKEKVKQYANI